MTGPVLAARTLAKAASLAAGSYCAGRSVMDASASVEAVFGREVSEMDMTRRS